MSFDGANGNEQMHASDIEHGILANGKHANRPTENGHGRYRDSGTFEGFGDDDFGDNTQSAKKFDDQTHTMLKPEKADEEDDYEDDFSDVKSGAHQPIKKKKSK